MNKTVLAMTLLAVLGLSACNDDDNNVLPLTEESSVEESTATDPQTNTNWSEVNEWYIDGQQRVVEAEKLTVTNEAGSAKNIILFVGDGMGVSTITAARILEGQLNGQMGEENILSFESFPYVGLSKTFNTDAQTPDSAGTMTAMMAGVKTDAGVISLAEGTTRGNCASTKDQDLVTALELAAMAGMSTGVVSTARVTHATPAATYAHVPERNWESDADLPDEAVINGCTDIAKQLLDFNDGEGMNVMLGGGRRAFIPNTLVDGEGKSGKRLDGIDLTEQWLNQYDNAAYVQDRAHFIDIDPLEIDHLLGLFNSSHMDYDADRTKEGVTGEPSLAEMTAKSIDILQKNDKGFVLIVEAGRIDHGHHAGNAARALYDTIALSEAVRVAMEKTSSKETLLMVTADHSHVMTMGGYPIRGNPILGLVKSTDKNGLAELTYETDSNGLPYTTLGYANGLGHTPLEVGGDERYDYPASTGRVDLNYIDTQSLSYHQEALIPLNSETHGGEDVAIFAQGPGAHFIQGTVEQNHIFHVINHAGNLLSKAEAMQ